MRVRVRVVRIRGLCVWRLLVRRERKWGLHGVRVFVRAVPRAVQREQRVDEDGEEGQGGERECLLRVHETTAPIASRSEGQERH